MVVSRRRRSLLAIVLVGLAVAHVVATRLSWSDIPMQTDNGIWAYNGWRVLDGALPYREIWDNKPPGIFYVFALVQRAFGVANDQALSWMDAVLSLAVFAITYVVSRRFASRVAAAGALCLLSLVFCHRVLADWGNNVEKFVALFEMTACFFVLRGLDRPGRWRDWLAAGVCCGLAGFFKQTGILFLAAATISMIIAPGAAPQQTRGGRRRMVATHIGLLWFGAAAPWIVAVIWMCRAGIFDAFWHQVVWYDLVRAGATGHERSRLTDPAHWNQVFETVKLAAILLGPACLGAAFWFRARHPVGIPTIASTKNAPEDSCGITAGAGLTQRHAALPTVVVAYWLLTTLLYPLVPHGFGHYLLQAAPVAAILAAWLFDRAWAPGAGAFWRTATTIAMLIALWPLSDHLRFTFDPGCASRQAFRQLGDNTRSLAAIITANTEPDRTVLLWQPDYPASVYAQRMTPLESSNAIVIFMGRIKRLDPPMSQLLDRLRRAPPDVIVDSTPVRVRWPGVDGASRQPQLLTPAAGFSMAEPPDDQHERIEGRVLAPLKRWVRANYGGQRRIGFCTFYYRGQPWRSWQDVLLFDEAAPLQPG